MKLITAIALLLSACGVLAANLPQVPAGAQAMTLSGKPLYSTAPGQAVLDKLAEAKKNYDANPNDADNIIWYGIHRRFSRCDRNFLRGYRKISER